MTTNSPSRRALAARICREAPERDLRPGLYVHVPFCLSRCAYCDFFSTTELDLRKRWLGALERELSLEPASAWASFGSLYLGGGTPSALADEALERIITASAPHLAAGDVEITVEANPDDLCRDRLRRWRGYGVNRVSVGVQSLDDDELRFLGRRHDASAARRALDDVRGAGFDNFSVDLISGLPGQPLERWRETLARVIATEPPHLSCYQLTIEPPTPLGRSLERCEIEALDGEAQRRSFLVTHEVLTGAGYEHYEISSFAVASRRSWHNQRYWRGAPYLGLGPSAHSFDGRERRWNISALGEYIEACEQESAASRPAMAGAEELTVEQRRVEALMLGLRTVEGVPEELILEAPANGPTLEAMVQEGLVARESGRVRPTVVGFLVADSLPLRLE